MRRAAVVLALVAGLLPRPAVAQDVLWRGQTLLGGRRALDGALVLPVQHCLLAEAGGARDALSVRLDMRAAMDSVDTSTAGLEVYELLVRHGRPGGLVEAVVGRQVLLTGTGAFLTDGAHVTLRTGGSFDVHAAAGIERHPELETPALGPHLALLGVDLRGVDRTDARATYLLRDDRDGRREPAGGRK